MYEEKDIPKYKKRSFKTTKKSKHKHVYEEYLLFDQRRERHYRARVCSICGKVYEVYFMETKKSEDGYSVLLHEDEILEKYNHLEKKHVNDIHLIKTI